jgi:hypothetical protein
MDIIEAIELRELRESFYIRTRQCVQRPRLPKDTALFLK